MKLYNKNELKHSRVFFDKKPPKFGILFIGIVSLLLVSTIVIASIVVRPYVVKAEGLVTTVDNQYIASSISGNVVEIVAVEGSSVSAGDTLIIISNGQENTQTSAILSQLETLSEKENALNKYLNALESGVNTLSNSGFEIEYFGKMTYYIDQVDNALLQDSANEATLEKKQGNISIAQTELVTLESQLESLNHEIELTEDEIEKTEKHLQINEVQAKIDTSKSTIEGLIEEIEQIKQQESMSSAESTRLQLLAEAGQANTALATQRTELEGQLNVYAGQDSMYEIKATNDGEIHYLAPMNLGLGLQQNQVFAEVSTHDDEHKIVEAYLSAFDRSKVEIGQKVNVKVQGVNSSQFGMLKGEVVSIENGTIMQETNQGNQSYYRIQISVNSFLLKGGDADTSIEVLKSMPVQTQIVYEEETYLMWILEMLSLKK